MTSIYKLLGLSLLLSIAALPSCTKTPERVEIEADTMIAMVFSNKSSLPEDAIYQWFFVAKPDESKSRLEVDLSKAQFLPDCSGEYDVHVTVLDSSGKVLAEQDFLFLTNEPDKPANSKTDQPSGKPSTDTIAGTEPQISEHDEHIIPSDTMTAEPDTGAEAEPPPPQSEEGPTPEPEAEVVPSPREQKEHLPEDVTSKEKYFIQIAALETMELARREQKYAESKGFQAEIIPTYRDDLDKVYYRVRLTGLYSLRSAGELKKELLRTTRYQDIWLAPAD